MMNREEAEKNYNELIDKIHDKTPDINLKRLNHFKLKIDVDSPLENFLGLVTGFFVLIFLFSLIESEFRHYFWIPLSGALFFGTLRYFTDNYYVIDSIQRVVIYHFSVLRFSMDIKKGSFSDVFCVIPNGERSYGRNGPHWLYYLTILTTKGKFIRISEPQTFIEMKLFEESGKEIAELLKVPYRNIKSATHVKVKNRPVEKYSDLKAVSARTLDTQHYLKKTVMIIIFILAIYLIATNWSILNKFFMDLYFKISNLLLHMFKET